MKRLALAIPNDDIVTTCSQVTLISDHSKLAQNIHKHFQQDLHHQAYRFELNQEGDIIWQEYMDSDKSNTYHKDPNSTMLQRFMLTPIGWLPIQKLL